MDNPSLAKRGEISEITSSFLLKIPLHPPFPKGVLITYKFVAHPISTGFLTISKIIHSLS